MEKTIILLLTPLCLFSCNAQPNPKVWTAKYEQGLYDYLNATSKPTMPDSVKRLKYVLFVIARLKEEIPNGLNSVSKDSLHNLNIKIGREFALEERKKGIYDTGILPYYTPWTPMIEKTFRDDFFALFQHRDVKVVNEFCDCIIEELKKTYRDSILVPVPNEVMSKVAIDCKNKTGIN
jgi:hypothetical protein